MQNRRNTPGRKTGAARYSSPLEPESANHAIHKCPKNIYVIDF
jgi:hypothetical protein